MNENQIREQAYYFWEKSGCPEGRDEEFWDLAKVHLQCRELTASFPQVTWPIVVTSSDFVMTDPSFLEVPYVRHSATITPPKTLDHVVLEGSYKRDPKSKRRRGFLDRVRGIFS